MDPGEPELPPGFPLQMWPTLARQINIARATARQQLHEERLEWYRARGKQLTLGPPVTFESVRLEFLAMLDIHGNVQAAADLVGISSQTVRRNMETNEEFSQQVKDVMERHRKQLVDEAYRRGIEGYEEPVYWQGILVGTKTCYSDKLLELLLKARGGPEFRAVAKDEQPTVNINVHLLEAQQRLAALPREKRDALRALLAAGEGGDVIDVEVLPGDPGDSEGN